MTPASELALRGLRDLSMIKWYVIPLLAVVFYIYTSEMKKALAPHAKTALVALSPPGRITDELISAVKQVLSEGKGAVFVVGEDDLSSLLVMAQARKGTLVYGQPDMGAVVVALGEKSVMDRAQKALDQMEKI